MNRIILLALVALSLAALAAGNIIPGGLDEERSELSLAPSDDAETDKLIGTNLEGFRDFCIRTRDTVVSDMKNRGNIFASDVFASIFRSLGEIAQTSVKANARATDRLSRQLTSPDSPIEENNQEQVDQIIAEGQRAIQEAGSQPQGLFAAFMGGIKSFAVAGYGEAISRILELQKRIGAKAISQNLIGFCEQLTSYEKLAIEIFEETKSSLVEENAEQYKDVQYGEVSSKCITANRLSRAEGLCKFVLASKQPLAKIFRFELPGDSSKL